MTLDEFFRAICAALGWPATPWRLAVMKMWATREGMPFERTWNPWATTQPGDLDLTYDNGYGPGNWNWVPVRVYRTPEAGIKATVETLTNGYYPNILRCFADQTGYQEAVGPRDFTSWVGSASYGQAVVDFMNACTESKGDDDMTEEQLKTFKELWRRTGGDAGNDFDLLRSLQNTQAVLTALADKLSAAGQGMADDDKARVADALEAAAEELRK